MYHLCVCLSYLKKLKFNISTWEGNSIRKSFVGTWKHWIHTNFYRHQTHIDWQKEGINTGNGYHTLKSSIGVINNTKVSENKDTVPFIQCLNYIYPGWITGPAGHYCAHIIWSAFNENMNTDPNTTLWCANKRQQGQSKPRIYITNSHDEHENIKKNKPNSVLRAKHANLLAYEPVCKLLTCQTKWLGLPKQYYPHSARLNNNLK